MVCYYVLFKPGKKKPFRFRNGFKSVVLKDSSFVSYFGSYPDGHLFNISSDHDPLFTLGQYLHGCCVARIISKDVDLTALLYGEVLSLGKIE